MPRNSPNCSPRSDPAAIGLADDSQRGERDARAERDDEQLTDESSRGNGVLRQEAAGGGSDRAEQQPESDHRQRLEQRAMGDGDGKDQAEHDQREVIRRAEFERHGGRYFCGSPQ